MRLLNTPSPFWGMSYWTVFIAGPAVALFGIWVIHQMFGDGFKGLAANGFRNTDNEYAAKHAGKIKLFGGKHGRHSR